MPEDAKGVKIKAVTAEVQEKLDKIHKAKDAMESLFRSLQKLETNLRSLQESALLLKQLVEKFQQLPPEQRARVARIVKQTLRPEVKNNVYFISSTLH